MIVYLARDIPPLVMYCINGESRSSLLIESTDSMINPRRACAARVTVTVLGLSVCVFSLFWQYRDEKYNERYHRVKRQFCGNIKKAFFFKLSYSKVRAFFTYLGRGGHL